MRSIFNFLGGICAFTFAIQAQASSLDSLGVEQRDGRIFVIHKVDKGETLYSLSKRYSVSLEDLIDENDIIDNQLALEQELLIPLPEEVVTDVEVNKPQTEIKTLETKKDTLGTIIHTVNPGETLYAISKKYEVDVTEIKSQNQLESNELSVGQELIIVSKTSKAEATDNDQKTKEGGAIKKVEESKIPAGFTEYYVQSGESLESIAGRFSVRPDSIVYWNKLPNSYLSIGQKLLIRGELDQGKLLEKEEIEQLPYGTRKEVKDQSGFTKIFEEGTASKIDENMSSTKYLALHRSLSVGSLIEVRNLMNNQKIFVRVVGKLPETGLNKNVMIRLTPICFERLGVIDPKTRVEVSYFLD